MCLCLSRVALLSHSISKLARMKGAVACLSLMASMLLKCVEMLWEQQEKWRVLLNVLTLIHPAMLICLEWQNLSIGSIFVS